MRTALVTGASRGIGRAISQELAAAGWKVLAPARSELDLAEALSVAAFCSGLRASGVVDALVNNAGINLLNPVAELRDEDWAAMLQVNVTAPMQLMRAVAGGMSERGWGRIVNISSMFGIVSRPGRAAYSTTKAAINSLGRTAAIEFGPAGILVNSVCPGYVETELTYTNNSPAEIEKIKQTIPLRRLAAPGEIAKLVAFLCSDANSYLTGQTLVADGGFTCL